MTTTRNAPVHTFHIPVMGTGFTIDTPLRVARFGISSVISLVDDVLIEQMRKYHALRSGEPYSPIPGTDREARAKRITEYMNLLGRLIDKQMDEIRAEPFGEGGDIDRYFEYLPESSLKDMYRAMLATTDENERTRLQTDLRNSIVPGSVDVNIMTKLDRTRHDKGQPLPPEYSDAKAALRGFAMSALTSSIVCSAGMNRWLFKYFSAFDDFYPDSEGELKKKIIIKVSDFRSAEFQGRTLAKQGLWVSEYRIESGLNCGGHAFATKGNLLGPILGEFVEKRASLAEELNGICNAALSSLGRPSFNEPKDCRITVQGGIGTADEDRLLRRYYRVDGTGWGTPFMLVPDVVLIDGEHLEKLASATDDDVYLSDSSPLGVPFWNLRTSASEERRRERIRLGTPGSPCRKNYLKIDTSVSESPICRASQEFQKRRLALLENEDLTPEERVAEREAVLVKSCICHDLAGCATLSLGIDPQATPAICCGPNIVNFSKIASLKEMIDHIYGRISLLTAPDRPHMFARELMIYIDYFRNEAEKNTNDISDRTREYLTEFRNNLLSGIEYYQKIAEIFIEEKTENFIQDIRELKAELESIPLVEVC